MNIILAILYVSEIWEKSDDFFFVKALYKDFTLVLVKQKTEKWKAWYITLIKNQKKLFCL